MCLHIFSYIDIYIHIYLLIYMYSYTYILQQYTVVTISLGAFLADKMCYNLQTGQYL